MPPTLFKQGAFLSHAGIKLPFKIDCDALGVDDLHTMAQVVATRLLFNDVYGIPTGGVRFADCLAVYKKPCPVGKQCRMLIVDDVLTTGKSMQEAKQRWAKTHCCVGVVLFAREVWPFWVWPVFTLAPSFRSVENAPSFIEYSK